MAGSHISIHTWPEEGYTAIDVLYLRRFRSEKSCGVYYERIGGRTPTYPRWRRGSPHNHNVEELQKYSNKQKQVILRIFKF